MAVSSSLHTSHNLPLFFQLMHIEEKQFGNSTLKIN